MSEPLNIFNSVASKQLSEITTDLLEAGIDQLIENDFLKDIPIIGTGFKVYSLAQKIQDAFLAKKIIHFLFQLKDIPQDKREEFANSFSNDKKNQKSGETVLALLNRLDDITKASIVGKLLKAAILESISYSDFLRLTHIVESSFLDDLMVLKDNSELYDIDKETKVLLNQSGLLIQQIKDNREFEKYVQEQTGSSRVSYPPTFEYKLNSYGHLLIKYGL